MKKMNVLAAVVAVLAAASVAKAEGLSISFDTPAGGGLSFAEASGSAQAPEAGFPEVAVRSGTESDEGYFYKLSKQQKSAIFGSALPAGGLSGELLALAKEEKIDILYNERAVHFVSMAGGNYKTVGTISDKRVVKALIAGRFARPQMKNAVVCKFVEMVVWELVKGVWTEVIKKVQECYTEPDSTYNPANTGSGGPITWPERAVQL